MLGEKMLFILLRLHVSAAKGTGASLLWPVDGTLLGALGQVACTQTRVGAQWALAAVNLGNTFCRGFLAADVQEAARSESMKDSSSSHMRLPVDPFQSREDVHGVVKILSQARGSGGF